MKVEVEIPDGKYCYSNLFDPVAKSFTHIRCNLYVSPEYNELEDNWCNLYSDVMLPIETSENHDYVLKHPDCPSLLKVTG